MDKTDTNLAQASIELLKALDLRLDTHHIKWLESFDRPWQRRLQLSPRGHGKSTVWGVLGALSSIVHEQSRRVLIVFKTETLASRLLKQVGYCAKRLNEAGMLPEIKTFNNTELRFKGVASKEPNITAVGVLGSVTGMHFDIMIGDDILDDRNTRQLIAQGLGIKGLRFEFNELDAEDELAQAQVDKILIEAGVLKPDEVRARMGMK